MHMSSSATVPAVGFKYRICVRVCTFTKKIENVVSVSGTRKFLIIFYCNGTIYFIKW